MRTKNVAHRHTQRRIEEILAEHLGPKPKVPSTCRYPEDWSDGKIAGIIGCSESSVQKIRMEDYGTLRLGKIDPGGGTPDELTKRVEQLEIWHTIQADMITALTDRITSLEDDRAARGAQMVMTGRLVPRIEVPLGGANGADPAQVD